MNTCQKCDICGLEQDAKNNFCPCCGRDLANEPVRRASSELPPVSGYPRTLPAEFYNQRRWKQIHEKADDLIATKSGKVLAALYRSPDERLREDYMAFVEMLTEWAKSVEADNNGGERPLAAK